MDLFYPFRLIKNAIQHLLSYGFRSTLSKSKQVFRKHIFARSLGTLDENKLYTRWIENTEVITTTEALAQKLKTKPLISILMPVYNVDQIWLEKAIDSIRTQIYDNWELCITDDCSTEPHIKETLERYKKLDKRIKIQYSEVNNHISITTNKSFEMSKGNFVFLMDNDDEISPDCFYEYAKVINKHPDADLIYSDEDKLDVEKDKRIEPWFKPDFSPELLLSMMYPTHGLYSRKMYKRAGMLRKGYEGSQDYDLCLRAVELTDKIYHIPKVLYHWRKVPGSTADKISSKSYAITASRTSLNDAFERRGIKGKVVGESYPFRPIPKIIKNPSVDIIIPTKDKVKYLKRCIESIQTKTDYTNYTITIVDNRSELEETKTYFEEVSKSSKVKVLEYNFPFNYSSINNFAAKQSTAELLLFLNNDTEVLNDDWLSELVRWAQLKDIGAVGAKLLFPDRTVQHAGIIVGLGGIANHAYYLEPESSVRYYNHLNCVKNYSAVTGACLMVSKKKFEEVNGFNEQDLAVAYNDVDLCLKLIETGYRNMYTPYAQLLHYESISRKKHKHSKKEEKYMKDHWSNYLKHDPAYNINFDKTSWQSFYTENIERYRNGY